MVDRNCQKTSATQVRRETLGQKPEREDHPKAVQSHPVSQRRFRGVPHPQHDGAEPLEHGHPHSGQHIEQEKIHQEKEERASQCHVPGIHPDEKPVENRVEKPSVRPGKMLRHEQSHFDVAEDNQHEPSEGDGGVHVAKQRLALPDLRVEKAVAEQIPDVLECCLRSDQRLPEPPPVLRRNLGQKPYQSHGQPDQHETDADHERNHKVVVAGRNPVDDFGSGLKRQ